MSVHLMDIEEGNFEECVALSVREDQPFVAPNVYSIAQSRVSPYWVIKAIYADEVMVGFAMYTLDLEAGELYLCRFMIDRRHQGRGYGRAALDLLRSIAEETPGIRRMRLSTEPSNAAGIGFYETFGFTDTGTMEDDEEVFVLDLLLSGQR
jgi:diamine N-acetyltransferase